MADLVSTGDQSAQAFRDILTTMLSAAMGLAVVMGLLIAALAAFFA